MTAERKLGIIYSQASLPPQISIFASSETISRYLKRTQAEGVEILPTWGISAEVLLFGRLKNGLMVDSFHQSWMKDFGIEKRYGNGTQKVDFLVRPVFFPIFTPLTDRVMRTLWQECPGIPTTVHTLDSDHTLGHGGRVRFYLELAHQNGVNLPALITWVGEKPTLRGIVYPTRDDQLDDWKIKYAGDKKNLNWYELAEEMMPYLRSVHLGPLTTSEIEAYIEGNGMASDTEERLESLYKAGFEGSAVIEIDPRKVARVAKSLSVSLVSGYSLIASRFKRLRDRVAGF